MHILVNLCNVIMQIRKQIIFLVRNYLIIEVTKLHYLKKESTIIDRIAKELKSALGEHSWSRTSPHTKAFVKENNISAKIEKRKSPRHIEPISKRIRTASKSKPTKKKKVLGL